MTIAMPTRGAGWRRAEGFSDPAALEIGRSLFGRLAAPVISLIVLLSAVRELRMLELANIVALVPRAPGFWLLFVASYAAPVMADWLIFRRLWRIPASGVVPLLRKFIGNEILLGYIGEIYFYAWARRNGRMSAAPFGAVKDVTVLSAMVGNAVTLTMLALALPFYHLLRFGGRSGMLLASVGTLLLTSLLVFAFRGRLFALPRAELRFVAGIHLARIVTTTALAASMWHVALPAVALSWWLLLAALRLLLSRLPFIPNKDVVFAGIAVLLVGHDGEIAVLMAMLASLMLTVHLILGIGLMAAELASRREATG